MPELSSGLILPSDMSTLGLTKELALDAEMMAPEGILPEDMKAHVVDVTNRHLLTSGEPRHLFVAAYTAMLLPGSPVDVEFMTDGEVGETVIEQPVLAQGHLYGVEHLSSVAFTGFGLRFFGVRIIQPEPARVETMLVPVDSVSVVLASK